MRSLPLMFWCCSVHYNRHLTCRRMVQNVRHPFDELKDMTLLYGESENYGVATVRPYSRQYLQWWHPNRRIFIYHLWETCRMLPDMTNDATPRVCSSVNVEVVLHVTEQSPNNSTRQLSCCYVSLQVVVRVWHYEHVQALQSLLNYEKKKQYCEWPLLQDAAFTPFLRQMMVTNEAWLTHNRILNTCYHHTWADKKPHSFYETWF